MDDKRPAERSVVTMRLQRLFRVALVVGTFVAVLGALLSPDRATLIYLLSVLGLIGILGCVLPLLGPSRAWSRRISPKYALLVGSLITSMLVAEYGVRTFCRGWFYDVPDERSLLYQYDRRLGWFPRSNDERVFFGTRSIRVKHNSQGFRDVERTDGDKPAIIFLGDSFVWGYDVEASERFTDKLQALHPELAIYSMGVSGYGTDQEFLLLQEQLKRVRPILVFLVYCTVNDDMENSENMLQRQYYKPYFTEEEGRLRLHGVPVPRSERVLRSEHPVLSISFVVRLIERVYCERFLPAQKMNKSPTTRILLEMNSYLKQRNILFAVGFTAPETNIQATLKDANIPWIDLSTTNRYEGGTGHWTPEGQDFVRDQVANFLLTEHGGLVRDGKTGEVISDRRGHPSRLSNN